LSDAFCNEDPSGEFEWTATVINLNHEDNRELLGKYEILREYTDLVTNIWKLSKRTGEIEAVDKAVVECIEQKGELLEILLAHRAEVVNMLLTEFDEETFVKDIHAEGLAEGLEQGLERGLEQGREEAKMESIQRMIRKGKFSFSDIAECNDVPLEKVEEIARTLSSK